MEKIKVMSFNVRCGELTESRIARVAQAVKNEMPDVLGIQEGHLPICEGILNAVGGEYEMHGVGRDGSPGDENSNVFYRKSVFNCIEAGTKWLSDTPDFRSEHPKSAYPRIFSYQLLERKSDGQKFLHISTHLDYTCDEVKVYQAERLVKWIENRVGNSVPVAIVGDFNAREKSPAYNVFIDAGYEATNSYGESKRTFNGYRDDMTRGGVIDFCFVNKKCKVLSYRVCDEKLNGEWISDHNAIISEIEPK